MPSWIQMCRRLCLISCGFDEPDIFVVRLRQFNMNEVVRMLP